VRHRGKIDAALNNAKRAIEIADEFGSLAAFLWRFEPDPEARAHLLASQRLETLSTSPESAAMAKELKRRGWAFLGPTTAYAFMQAMGLVNDHAHDCCVREEVERARSAFVRP
jgi:DNA-3-methyladenine glycosylase I